MRPAALALAAAAAGLAAAAPAAAQDPGTEVGGTVPSYLALGLDDPEGFATFPAGAGEYELRIRARVTTTDGRVPLSVADGDVASGGRLGRLAGSASVLDAPLEARVGAAAFQPLDATSTRCSPRSAARRQRGRDDRAAPADRRRRAPARHVRQDALDHAVRERA